MSKIKSTILIFLEFWFKTEKMMLEKYLKTAFFRNNKYSVNLISILYLNNSFNLKNMWQKNALDRKNWFEVDQNWINSKLMMTIMKTKMLKLNVLKIVMMMKLKI